jgi:hypothetical protein
MIELDQNAQAEAAFNVLLPPELHRLVGGGGRGNRKAQKPAAPENPAPEPTFTGIAKIRRAEHLANRDRDINDADPPSEPPAPKGPVAAPESRSPERARPRRDDDRRDENASSTGPQNCPPEHRLMTMEEAFTPPRRQVPRR